MWQVSIRDSHTKPNNARRALLGKFVLAIFALLMCSGVGATAYVRFANVALVGPEGSSPLVELRLAGDVIVSELGYKSATGYFEVAHGTPLLTVWLDGTQIVERVSAHPAKAVERGFGCAGPRPAACSQSSGARLPRVRVRRIASRSKPRSP